MVSEASLSEALLDEIAARSDGVPLFVEELAKSVVESGRDLSAFRSELAIPETLRDSLMARLDRLGEAKQVAQLGAALGREFPYSLLEAVAPVEESGAARGARPARRGGAALPAGSFRPRRPTSFKHALVRDAAYQTLLKSQRREIHGRIADALENRFAEWVVREPEVVGHHSAEAGRAADAITHYERAGERATQRSAHAEAIAHLRRAIGLLDMLTESPERNRHELRLQLALGAPLQATQGFMSPEVEETYERAFSLSRDLGEAPERFQALAGLATFYRNHDAKRALELGEKVLAHAERTGEPSQLLFAHCTLGIANHYLGSLSSALAHEERATAHYDPIEHRSLELVYGLDPGVSAVCLASFTLWQLGHPDRALERVEEGIELARANAQPLSLAYALNWGSVVHYGRGEPRRVLERAEEAIVISKERGLRQQLDGARIFRTWALSLMADAKHGAPAVDEVLGNFGASIPGMASPVSAPFISAIIDALLNLQRLEDLLLTVDSGLVRLTEMHAPYWNPELQRLKGEIQLARDPTAHEAAESLFLLAIETAKGQEAKSLELRAATSLARSWQRQGREEEARALLAPVYDWFTEGFDTRDLEDAKALLDELA